MDLCEKIKEDMTGGLSIILEEKLLSIEHIFVTRQMFARQYLELTLANYVHS